MDWRARGILGLPERGGGLHVEHSPLHNFEVRHKFFVDFGLFFFAFTNAGLSLAGIGPMRWLILGSLVIGKVVGISALGLLVIRRGFPLPNEMGVCELMMAALVAALGLTVAIILGRALGMGGSRAPDASDADTVPDARAADAPPLQSPSQA